MARPRKTPAAPAPAPVPPALPRPITIDVSRLEIPDLGLMLRMQNAAALDDAARQALVFEMIPMLERLTVGGLAGFKLVDLPAVIVEIFAQLQQVGAPGN